MASTQTSSSTHHPPQHHHHHHHNSNNNNNNNNNNSTNGMTSKEKEREKEKKLSMYKVEPYKTELRREHIARRRELTRQHFLPRERTQAAGRHGEGGGEGGHRKGHHGKTVSRNVVTIDTHKARGNIDVLRMVIRDLGWREVRVGGDHNRSTSCCCCCC